MKYLKPIILLLGIISEGFLIYTQYMNSNGDTKSGIMILMHSILCAFFVFAFIADIRRLTNKDK